MAASACFVPGPSTPSPVRAADGLPGHPADPAANALPGHPAGQAANALPGHPPERALPRLKAVAIGLALVAWALLGFASGVGLSILTVPIAGVASVPTPDVASGLRPAGPTYRGRSRFWRPAGSTAVLPVNRLRPRVYRPAYVPAPMRVAGWTSTGP